MKLELQFYDSLCETSVFVINGVKAGWREFGVSNDIGPEPEDWDPDFGDHCANRVFEPIAARPEVLARYGISEAEYAEIAEKLREGLSFGRCGWCH